MGIIHNFPYILCFQFSQSNNEWNKQHNTKKGYPTHYHPTRTHRYLYVKQKQNKHVCSSSVQQIIILIWRYFVQRWQWTSFSPSASFPVPSEPVAASSVLRGRAHGWDRQHGGGGARSAAGSSAGADDPSPASLHLLLLCGPLPFLPGIWDLVRLHALWQIFTFQEKLQQAHVHPLR